MSFSLDDPSILLCSLNFGPPSSFYFSNPLSIATKLDGYNHCHKSPLHFLLLTGNTLLWHSGYFEMEHGAIYSLKKKLTCGPVARDACHILRRCQRLLSAAYHMIGFILVP